MLRFRSSRLTGNKIMRKSAINGVREKAIGACLSRKQSVLLISITFWISIKLSCILHKVNFAQSFCCYLRFTRSRVNLYQQQKSVWAWVKFRLFSQLVENTGISQRTHENDSSFCIFITTPNVNDTERKKLSYFSGETGKAV